MRMSGVVIALASCGTFTENDTLSSYWDYCCSHSISEPWPCGSDISGASGMSSGRFATSGRVNLSRRKLHNIHDCDLIVDAVIYNQ